MKLKRVALATIEPTTPFNFDATFHKPDHFTTGDNFWQPGTRWQTWRQDNFCLGLKFEKAGTVNRPEIKLSVYSENKLGQKAIDDLMTEVSYRYNLDLDLAELYKQSSKDKILYQAIDNLRGMRPGHPSSLYEYLIIGVVLQNVIQLLKAEVHKRQGYTPAMCLFFCGL